MGLIMPLTNVSFILSAPDKKSWPIDDKKEVVNNSFTTSFKLLINYMDFG